jgi:hypothetical protein
MREFKFRGKRKDNSKWVTGSLMVEYDGSCFITYWVSELTEPENNFYEQVQKNHEVVSETVGQLSPHDLKLFEGDIVNYVTGNPKRYVNAIVEFGEYETYAHYNKDEGDVEKHFGFYINDGESKMPLGSLWLQKIGNRFDNPELVNPAAKEQLTNTMTTDPKEVKAAEATAEQATEQQNAQESASQDKAMEVNSEEGTTEG